VSSGSDALSDVYAKLDWATKRHDDMQRLFEDFAKPGGGDERPYGIRFRERDRPAGLVVASFIVEQPMPLEMSLLAADLVHNTRVALDHVLARLKDHFGGDAGRGSFPTWQSEDLWQEKVVKKGKGSALYGLDQPAVDLIFAEQPLHRTPPAEDPLVILNKLDNADKHRLLHQAFVYPGVDRGVDLIELLDRTMVKSANNLWNAGQPLENATGLARFMIRGDVRRAIRARPDALIGFAWRRTRRSQHQLHPHDRPSARDHRPGCGSDRPVAPVHDRLRDRRHQPVRLTGEAVWLHRAVPTRHPVGQHRPPRPDLQTRPPLPALGALRSRPLSLQTPRLPRPLPTHQETPRPPTRTQGRPDRPLPQTHRSDLAHAHPQPALRSGRCPFSSSRLTALFGTAPPERALPFSKVPQRQRGDRDMSAARHHPTARGP
jgi:hypothetical protein